MDILQIALAGIVSMLLALYVRQYRPELSPLLTLAAGIFILLPAMSVLEIVIDKVVYIANECRIDSGYISIILKVIAIAYICQFSSDMCKDAGQSALAGKIEFAARILILFQSLPIATALIDMAVSILP